MALEHTFEDVYASAASAADRRTGVHRRDALLGSSTASTEPATAWPFSTPAYVAALDLARDAVLIVDRAGSVRYANASSRALFERARPEGRHVLELARVEPGLVRGMLRTLRDRSQWRGLARVEVQGHPRELELSVAAVKVDDWGRAHAFSVSARAIEPLRALSKRNAARDVFSSLARVVGAAAHDFNNQISVVLNYSFILLRELPGDRPERAHMEELQQAAWRAADTARHLLRLGGKRGPEPSALDVNDVIRDAHAALSMFARNPSDAELRLSHTPCITKARQSELEWLLLELTQRLRSRVGELKHLRIATSHVPQRACIRILLDGLPYPDDTSSRLLASDSESPESAPRLSTQLGYKLALQVLPDDGLRYVIELPAL